MPLCSVRLSKKRHFTQLKSEPSSTVFTSPEESLTPSLSPFHLGLMVSNVIVFCYLPFGFWSRRVEGLSTEHSVPCFGTWPHTSLSQHTVCNGWPSCAFFVVVVSKPNQRETQEKSGESSVCIGPDVYLPYFRSDNKILVHIRIPNCVLFWGLSGIFFVCHFFVQILIIQ